MQFGKDYEARSSLLRLQRFLAIPQELEKQKSKIQKIFRKISALPAFPSHLAVAENVAVEK